MIILISGASHVGKTRLAQIILEKKKYTYLSIDHLKMGLIRSKETNISVDDDANLTPYLWRIVKEMIKTAIENKQDLIVEGVNIPFDWKKDFKEEYAKHIKYICIALSEDYIDTHFDDILKNASCIENRQNDDYLNIEYVKRENKKYIEGSMKEGCKVIIIEKNYKKELRKILKEI